MRVPIASDTRKTKAVIHVQWYKCSKAGKIQLKKGKQTSRAADLILTLETNHQPRRFMFGNLSLVPLGCSSFVVWCLNHQPYDEGISPKRIQWLLPPCKSAAEPCRKDHTKSWATSRETQFTSPFSLSPVLYSYVYYSAVCSMLNFSLQALYAYLFFSSFPHSKAKQMHAAAAAPHCPRPPASQWSKSYRLAACIGSLFLCPLIHFTCSLWTNASMYTY